MEVETRGPYYTMEYTSQDSTGVSILVAVSVLSFLAVLVLLFALALSAFNTRQSSDRFLFVRTHAAAYFVSLMICWLVQCIASLMNGHWLRTNTIFSGSFCSAQGALKHISDVGVAVWTFVMATNTFCHLFLELNTTKYVMWSIMTAGWFFIGIIVGIGPAAFSWSKGRGPFYDVNGVWCWISSEYKVQIITLGYMIILLSALLSSILYILTFLRLRGNVERNGWMLKFSRVTDSADKYFSSDRTKQVARQMLLYPLVYAILVVPIAITRFIEWSGKETPFELTIFSASVYMLSGFTNVILFTTTRRILPLASMRIGNWYLVPSSRPSTPDGDDMNPSKGALEDEAEKGASKTIIGFGLSSKPITTSPGRRESRRPAELDLSLNRDSFASMYSAREGVWTSQQQPMSSHWRPDTPPLQRSSRLPMYLQAYAKAKR